MILQAGANSNVFAYNYSLDPYWRQGIFPSNTAGDMVLHGNYPYLNLFEGNVAQNLVIDDSHGQNGLYNTFFRNKVEGTGITCIGQSPSSYQNILANEVTGSGLFGGYFLMMGSNHWLQYNLVGDEIQGISTAISNPSLFLTEKPTYFGELDWPIAGEKEGYNKHTLPAQIRFSKNEYTTIDHSLTQRKTKTEKKKKSLWERIFK